MSGSVPSTHATIIPGLRCRDAPAANDWPWRTFEFERHAVRVDGRTVHHAQQAFGTRMIMLGSMDEASRTRVAVHCQARRQPNARCAVVETGGNTF